jgi:hypothetical protein
MQGLIYNFTEHSTVYFDFGTKSKTTGTGDFGFEVEKYKISLGKFIINSGLSLFLTRSAEYTFTMLAYNSVPLQQLP